MQASQTGTVENKKPALSPEDVLSTITTALDTNKAEEIVPIELKGKTSLADYMVIASGNSQRQVSALCDYVIKALKAIGGPYVGLKFIPTGGINTNNLADYLSLLMVHACGGSFMVKKQLITDGKFDEIRGLTETAVNIVKSVRS